MFDKKKKMHLRLVSGIRNAEKKSFCLFRRFTKNALKCSKILKRDKIASYKQFKKIEIFDIFLNAYLKNYCRYLFYSL